MPFRRRVFVSCSDGKTITIGQLYRNITNKEEFRLLDDLDAVRLCLLDLKDVTHERRELHFNAEGTIREEPPKYSLHGFMWAFKANATWLTPDEMEVRMPLWVACNAYFEGSNTDAPPDGKIKHLKDELKKLRSMTQEPVQHEPMFVSEHCGLSDFSQFQNKQGFKQAWQSTPHDAYGVDAGDLSDRAFCTQPSLHRLLLMFKNGLARVGGKKRTANIARFDLGKAVDGEDAGGGDDVDITDACFTEVSITMYNVNPSKHINAWIELLIRTRLPNTQWTVAKAGTTSLYPKEPHTPIPLLDQAVKGTLDSTTPLYPSWDVVEWVFMPLNVGGYMWDCCQLLLYGQSARLYVGDDHIWSTTGVQQGDPLGPLLFALVLHPLVHRIRDCCQLLFHAWYLDDGTIIGDTKEVAKAIDIIRAEGPRLGLELNIKKTEVFWPSCNGVKVKEGLFLRDIGRPTLGVKLLGGAVSRDAGFISSLAVKRASRAVELMSLLSSLRDPQSELLLLRSCMGVAKLLFGLRTCQPMYIGEAVSIFDNGLRRAIEAIVVCGGPFFGDFQWRLASLPIRFGGLGLCSAEDVSTYAFVASRAQSWSLQDHILQGCGIDGADSDYGYALDRVRIEIVKSLGVSFDLSPRQKAVVECLRAPRAQNFLTVIPIEGLGQHMSALEYRTILKYRLMIPLFPVDEPCPVCRKVCLDSFGEHAVHCKELPGFKYRHDLVRDVLYDVLKRAGISSRKEAPVNFLTDPLEGRSTLRPADILVFGWAGGKHACVDLTGVSPLVGLRDNGFVAGQAALKAESSKVAKHEKACLENQHVFIPFAFDTFGFLAPEAEEFLNRVQRVVQIIIEQLVKDGEKNVFWSINEEVQESLLNLTSICRIILDTYAVSQDLDEFKTIS
ncbi:putative reverse transcriptase domain-containing protein [Tanacetum coccineum]|uniref:Reverse transcriptase domain-containing protein n=1 Tax=Tanacetum coccineum TaxID=301880 RepID=A0ABQ5IRH3_9ASTR